MRLIDADELVKAIENENPGMSISGTVEKFARTTQVKMQPTIDAIPVEWIISKSQDCLVDRYITGTEMKFIKFLIDEWRLSK